VTSATALFGLYLQTIVVLLGCANAYYIWRQLTLLVLSGQASVNERLASQSIEIIKYIADDPQLYEYFYLNKELSADVTELNKVFCCAEMLQTS
jgi:hypothetical protein